jgi:hypothetical protein
VEKEEAMMQAFIYGLCGLTSLLCAALLWRSYRDSGYRLLFWSALCFCGLTLTNVVLMLDKFIFLDVDLLLLRLSFALLSLLPLLYGLINDE